MWLVVICVIGVILGVGVNVIAVWVVPLNPLILYVDAIYQLTPLPPPHPLLPPSTSINVSSPSPSTSTSPIIISPSPPY